MPNSSGSITALQTWLNDAGTVSGDIYVLDVETVTVTTGITISKGVTVRGSGIGNTVYYDNVSDGAIFTLDHTSLSDGEVIRLQDVEFRGASLVEHISTVYYSIQDHISSASEEPGTGGGAAYWTAAADSVANISGLPAWSSGSVAYKAGRGTDVDDGTVVLDGVNTSAGRVAVSGCKFDKLLNRENIRTNGALGVVYDCTSILLPQSYYFAYTFHKNWGGSGAHGDGSWAASVNWGTDEFMYFEDNTLSRAYDDSGMFDAQGGARLVIRHNTITDGRITVHGTESGGRPRGTRAFEIYGNTASTADDRTFFNVRSGSGVVFNNTWTRGAGSQPLIRPDIHRATNVFARVAGADGRMIFDNNNASNPYVTGTATGGTSTTLTDTSKSWTTDQYAGYTVRSIVASGTATSGTVDGNLFDSSASWIDDEWNGYLVWNKTQSVWGRVTDTIATGGEMTIEKIGVAGANMEIDVGDEYEVSFHSVIQSNTSDTLTVEVVGSHPIPFDGTIANGKAYEINLIDLLMDSPGAGAGYDYGNNAQFDMVAAAQAIDGIYEWGNTLNGGDGDFDANGRPGLAEGVTFFNDTVKPGYSSYTYPHPLRAVGSRARTLTARGAKLTLTGKGSNARLG